METNTRAVVANSTPTSNAIVDINNPLYVHLYTMDNLIPYQLTGNDHYNYNMWSRAMFIPMLAKLKIGFTDASCMKPNVDSSQIHQWKRCNVIVLSWIINAVLTELFAGIVYSASAH